MKTYLDIDEILRHRRRYIGQEYDEPYLVSAVPEEVIRSLPPADVVEVQHGRWKLHDNGDGTCSRCGFYQKHIWDMDGWQNFCGHCGADMREVDND